MKCRFKSKKLANSKHRESSYEADVPKTNYSELQQSQSNSMCSDSSQQSKTEHNCQFCESLCFENKKKLHWHYYSKNVKRGDLIKHIITCKNLIGQLLQEEAGIVEKK